MRPMSAGPVEVSTVVAGAVLLVALFIGVAAGRAKGRWSLLVTGLLAITVVGVVLTAVGRAPAVEDPAAELTALYTVTVPFAVAYVGGWLAARGPWLRRFLVVGGAALLLAAFPYAAAGRATADAFLGG